MTPPNSQLVSSGLHPCLHRWPVLAIVYVKGNAHQTKDCLATCSRPFISPLFSSPSIFFSHPLLLPFHSFISGSHSRFSLSSHLPSSASPLYSPLSPATSLSYSPLHPPRSAPPSRSPPPFILGSPTVVMRCFIICISQLLIEREFRLSPGSSVRELPWEA